MSYFVKFLILFCFLSVGFSCGDDKPSTPSSISPKTDELKKPKNMADELYRLVADAPDSLSIAQKNTLLAAIQKSIELYPEPDDKRDQSIKNAVQKQGGDENLAAALIAKVNVLFPKKNGNNDDNNNDNPPPPSITLAESGLPENIHNMIINNTHISQAQKDALIVLIKTKVWDKIERRRKKADRDARIDLIAADGANVEVRGGTQVAIPTGTDLASPIKRAFDEVVGPEVVANSLKGGLYDMLIRLKGTVSNAQINNVLAKMAEAVGKISQGERIELIGGAFDALAKDAFGSDQAGRETAESSKEGILREFNRAYPINAPHEQPRLESDFEGKLLSVAEGSSAPADFKVPYFIVQVTKSKKPAILQGPSLRGLVSGDKVYLPAEFFAGLPLNYGDIIQFNDVSEHADFVLKPGQKLPGVNKYINRVMLKKITGDVVNYFESP